MWELLQREYLEAYEQKRERRLLLSTRAMVTNLKLKDERVTGIDCVSTRDGETFEISAKKIVLAASPLESARLVMGSDLMSRTKGVANVAGRYLAEHLLCTAEIPVPFSSLAGGRVSVVVPPSGRQLVERFQIDVKNATFKGGSGGSSLRIFGFAAMDPNRDNRAVLGPDGLNTVVVPSGHDKARVEAMRGKMLQIAERLGARSGVKVSGPIHGRSNHEVGTLRMGPKGSESVTNWLGRVHDVENLYVADASVFPCVGVANPMLTTTALAYRLAHNIGCELGHAPEAAEPWSICGEQGGQLSLAASQS